MRFFVVETSIGMPNAPIFRESYEAFGPAHRLTHRCNFVVHSEDMGLRKVVNSDYCVNGA